MDYEKAGLRTWQTVGRFQCTLCKCWVAGQRFKLVRNSICRMVTQIHKGLVMFLMNWLRVGSSHLGRHSSPHFSLSKTTFSQVRISHSTTQSTLTVHTEPISPRRWSAAGTMEIGEIEKCPNENPHYWANNEDFLLGGTGLEPVTSCVSSRRSSQLS